MYSGPVTRRDMRTKERQTGLTLVVVTALAISAMFAAAQAGQEPAEPETSQVQQYIPLDEPHMAQVLRSAVKKVVVIAGESPPNEAVTGSFEKETAGLLGGMNEGSRIGTISKEIGGVPVNIPIPVLGTLGAIVGGISGATKREIQEFRDALADELISAESPQLTSDGLAIDAFWDIRKLPDLKSELFAPTVEIPGDTDAILYVGIDDLTIDIQGKEAIITTTAVATVRRLRDNWNVYETKIYYQDRDTLSNWTDNDNALWRDYTNFARYYLGREVAADVFDRINLNRELQPVVTETVKKDRKDKSKFVSDSLTPTLAWELELKGGDIYGPWTESIDESQITYDIEIFDNHQPVYYESGVPDPQHTVGYELEACQAYRWSVRPVYHVDGTIKFGEWMRFAPDAEGESGSQKGLFGRQASAAPAYTQDFARLEIGCGRR